MAGMSRPRTRIIGKLPTLQWRSEAPASTAVFSKSLTCMAFAANSRLERGGPCRPLSSYRRVAAPDVAGSFASRYWSQPCVSGAVAAHDVEEALLDRLR